MSDSFKTLHDCGEDYLSFLAQPDAEFIFTKGACHVFALALAEHLRKAKGRNVAIYYCYTQSEFMATHVFVKDGAKCWDASGVHDYHAIAHKWANSDISKLREVPNLGWLTEANPNYAPNTSFLGLCVIPDFMSKAAQKARALIALKGI